MQDNQEIDFDEEENNVDVKRKSFNNAAIQRQVNYVSNTPIDIDYLMLDRLNKLFEQSGKCGIT
jgi:hypothetical protein